MAATSGRDQSPASTLGTAQEPVLPSEPRAQGEPQPLRRAASTGSDTSHGDEKTKASSAEGEIMDEKATAATAANTSKERGVVEVDDGRVKRKAMVVIEDETGKEILKDVSGGPYTKPQW